MAIESQAALLIEQAAAQGALEQLQPFQRVMKRHFRSAKSGCGPGPLDLADPLDHHGVVIAMRPAVQRQTDPHHSMVVGGKQQTVVTEIVEVQSVPPETAQQGLETGPDQDLTGENMVALKSGIKPGFPASVDRPKRQSLAGREG